MNLTDPQSEKTYTPRCPNCNTDLTGTAKNFGSPAEGDYIVYVYPTCADYFGTQLDALVYQPIWKPRPPATLPAGPPLCEYCHTRHYGYQDHYLA